MLTICIILIVLLALDLLFTLALRCRKGHRKWEVLKKYRYAHRGYHDKPVVPENSLPAFRRAIERGFGAELDVHLLKDGTLAVFHDSDLKRCANVEGEIEDLTLDELKQLRLEGTDEQIPTFDEVLALFEHETPLIIERFFALFWERPALPRSSGLSFGFSKIQRTEDKTWAFIMLVKNRNLTWNGNDFPRGIRPKA